MVVISSGECPICGGGGFYCGKGLVNGKAEEFRQCSVCGREFVMRGRELFKVKFRFFKPNELIKVGKIGPDGPPPR